MSHDISVRKFRKAYREASRDHTALPWRARHKNAADWFRNVNSLEEVKTFFFAGGEIGCEDRTRRWVSNVTDFSADIDFPHETGRTVYFKDAEVFASNKNYLVTKRVARNKKTVLYSIYSKMS